ncbi:HIT-like domain-containing protein, partial [Coniochaeta sp. 2T2.1]
LTNPQVFLTTPLSFALVNLMPLLPGHVLVCPRTRHSRLTDLSPPELTDLFLSVQRVQRMLARHYFSPPPGEKRQPRPRPALEHGSFNIAVQDGVEAGQTVPHVHVHVIPRIHGWTAKPGAPGAGGGDELYERMAGEEGNVGGWLWDVRKREKELEEGKERPQPGGGFPPIEDKDRKVRGKEDMRKEAEGYRKVFEEMIKEEREGGKGKEGEGKGDVGSPEWWGKIWPKGGPEDAGPGY